MQQSLLQYFLSTCTDRNLTVLHWRRWELIAKLKQEKGQAVSAVVDEVFCLDFLCIKTASDWSWFLSLKLLPKDSSKMRWRSYTRTCSSTYGLISGRSCVEPGVRFNDLYGFLSTPHFLWFFDCRSCAVSNPNFAGLVSTVIVLGQTDRAMEIKTGVIILNACWTHGPERISFFLSLSSKPDTQIKANWLISLAQ